MHKRSETPVLVVGSGAAGSMLALELARHGIEARLIDRLPEASKYSRAVTVHARTLEILENIDPALAQRFLDRGMHSPGYVMHFVDEGRNRREVRPGLDFTTLPSRYPFLLIHRQDETEQTLLSWLRETYGRTTEWGVTCTSVVPGKGYVDATLQHADGRIEELRCQYLVACDGANSRIRKQLNLAQEGSDYAGTVLQNLDVYLDAFPDDPDWIHYCMGPAHFVMVVKLPGGFYRLLMSQPAERADASETPQHVFSGILAQHFDGIRFGETVWHSRWGSQVRLAHTYRQQNVFLAGDAAHVHSTAGGQGMNCCMQDACNLGWKLAMVLKGQARQELLDTYESERKPIGQQVIDAASSIHELFMAGRNDGPEALVELQNSGFLHELVGKVSGISYHYRTGDADGDDNLPCAGDRMPNVLLPDGKQKLNDLCRHGRYTLLAAMHAADDEASRYVHRIAARYPDAVVTAVLESAPAALLPKPPATQLYLIRPDGYLAYRCGMAETTGMDAYLSSVLLP